MESDEGMEYEVPSDYSNWTHNETGENFFVICTANTGEGSPTPPLVVLQSRSNAHKITIPLNELYEKMRTWRNK